MPHKNALVATDTGDIEGIVGAGYKVFTNDQAVTLRHKFCLQAFPDTTPAEWTFVEGHGPGTRSWAAMDINTDMSGPICGPTDSAPHVFHFPFGPLRLNVIYHVTAVKASRDGNQAVFLTGLRVMLDSREIGWNSSRFRKVDRRAGHVPKKGGGIYPSPRSPLSQFH